MTVVAMVKNSDNNKRRPTAAPTMKQGTVAASGVKLVDAWCNCVCINVALEATCSTITLWCMQTT